jgi:hypothetical protein
MLGGIHANCNTEIKPDIERFTQVKVMSDISLMTDVVKANY